MAGIEAITMSYIRWFNLLQIASCIPLFAIGVRINTDDDFIFEQDFNQPDIGNDFVFSDPAAWRIQFDNKNGLLELVVKTNLHSLRTSPRMPVILHGGMHESTVL